METLAAISDCSIGIETPSNTLLSFIRYQRMGINFGAIHIGCGCWTFCIGYFSIVYFTTLWIVCLCKDMTES